MPDFVFQPPAGQKAGFIAVAPSPAGSSISPAAPGSVLYNTPGDYAFRVPFGVDAVRVDLVSGGAPGALFGAITDTKGGTGGGGGGYAGATLGEGLIVSGSVLNIHISDSYSGSGNTTSGTCSVKIGTSSAMAATGGCIGSQSVNGIPGAGGGNIAGYGIFVVAGAMDVVIVNGENGTVPPITQAGKGGRAYGPLGGAGGVGQVDGPGGAGLPYGGAAGGSAIPTISDRGQGHTGAVRISWPPP